MAPLRLIGFFPDLLQIPLKQISEDAPVYSLSSCFQVFLWQKYILGNPSVIQKSSKLEIMLHLMSCFQTSSIKKKVFFIKTDNKILVRRLMTIFPSISCSTDIIWLVPLFGLGRQGFTPVFRIWLKGPVSRSDLWKNWIQIWPSRKPRIQIQPSLDSIFSQVEKFRENNS